ncbi:MAG: hypothetical protein D6800_03170 [Candidatus Zixiibacteriota bacterium]|nr:MAG: hypothetical protein D6800_03170 [candidate division Zixibacteria bacterium]
MYAYINGDLDWTENVEQARKNHLLSILLAETYPLYPEAAGRLRTILGPFKGNETREEVISRIVNALRSIGFSEVSVADVLRAVGYDWQLDITIGT